MRTRTTVACLCAAALVGITAFSYADHVASKTPTPQESKPQVPPSKATEPDATKPASGSVGKPLDDRCRQVKEDCLEKCCEKLPSGDCGFRYWNCVNECMMNHGCLGASKK